MKNIHILPTENSSRLSYNENQVLELNRLQWRKRTQNIYITSNEKFVRDEYITDGIEVIKAFPKLVDAQGLVNRRNWRKIILTTDQDLVKDGVQAIDNDFLEWFVTNPSCEWVELKGYAIILPGESCDCDNICGECEPKQETLEEAAKKYATNHGMMAYMSTEKKESFKKGAEWQQEQDKKLYSEEDMLNFAWFLKENLGQYSCDRTAHFEGKYLEQFKKK